MKEEILKRIEEHNEEVNITDTGVFLTALNGSQNYGLSDDKSDIDTNLFYIPSINDIAKNKYISRELHLENEEHCNIKDIREFFKMFKKGNINFVELLFTDYMIVNPMYYAQFNRLAANKEIIARYNEENTLNCALGIATSKFKHMRNSSPEMYNPKDLMNILRIRYFIGLYIEKEPYKQCIEVGKSDKLRDFLLDIKRNHTKDDYDKDLLFAQKTLDKMAMIIYNYKKSFKVDSYVQDKVDVLFEQLSKELIIERMKRDGVI